MTRSVGKGRYKVPGRQVEERALSTWGLLGRYSTQTVSTVPPAVALCTCCSPVESGILCSTAHGVIYFDQTLL